MSDQEETFWKLWFSEENGQLYYEYHGQEPIPGRSFSLLLYGKGVVPNQIVQMGKNVILVFAQVAAAAGVRHQWDMYQQREKRHVNVNIPVETRVNEILLKGHVVSAVDSLLVVHLDEPYVGQACIRFGFGSAMMGMYITNENGELTPEAIRSAKKLLIKIYKDQRRYNIDSPLADLIEELNKAQNQ